MKHLCFTIIIFFNVCWAASGRNNIPGEPSIEIVGGDEADIKDFPYIGAFLIDDAQLFCGATLISKNTVVTAARCIFHVSHRDTLKVRFGSSLWHSGGQEIYVWTITVHEKFSKYDYSDYDIAVAHLAEDVNVTNAVPIKLADANRQYPAGTLGVLSGFGYTSGSEPSKTLRKVEVPIVEESGCRDIYDAYGYKLTNRTICAGYQEGGKDFCVGDYGGPYVIDGELAGIASFGIGCGKPGIPGIYTSVPKFSDWIKSHAGI